MYRKNKNPFQEEKKTDGAHLGTDGLVPLAESKGKRG
jgi:hypothetical protein